MKDFYYILGTHSNSTQAEINEAYRKLAKRFEPGAGEHDDFLESHLREINEAYEILNDPIKRKRYDAALTRRHKKQIASFKVKSINIIATAALLLFTGVFGFYVFKSLRTTKTVEAAKILSTATVAPQKVRHHKKRHRSRWVAAVKHPAPTVAKKDTLPKMAPKVAHVPVVKPTVAPIVKPAQVAVVKQAPQPVVMVVKQDAQPASPTMDAKNTPLHLVRRINAPVDSSFVTYLKDNVGDQVYLHQLADYMSAVVTVLPSHAKLKVLEKNKTFYKVAYNNQVGYIPRWTVTNP